MSLLVALTNLIVGTAYVGIGVIIAIEMRRDWRSFGFSHFGAAFMLLAFTCGPHHLAHALHVGLEGRAGGSLDLLAVGVGLPAGVLWVLLRVEAFLGGRGDRFVVGSPIWLKGTLYGAAVYLVLFVAMAAVIGRGRFQVTSMMAPNLLLIAIYLTIAWYLIKTQLANRPGQGGWSVSGLSLSALFATCAVMHLAFALYNMTGTYHYDSHGFVLDWASVPAGIYFLWVTLRLYTDALRDWNGGPDAVLPTDSVLAGSI